MKMKTVVVRQCAMLMLIVAVLSAQAMGATKIRLLAFSRVGAAHEVRLTDSDGKPLGNDTLELPTQQLSKPREVASRSLFFLDPEAKVESVGADSKAPVGALGRVNLPTGNEEFLVIFLPNKPGAEYPYQVQAIAMPDSQFDSGAQAFLNYCNRDLGFIIDNQRVEVPVGKMGIYRPKKKEGNQVIVGYEKGEDDKWNSQPFYSSRLIVQSGVRNLILIVRNPQTGRLEFRGVTDFVN